MNTMAKPEFFYPTALINLTQPAKLSTNYITNLQRFLYEEHMQKDWNLILSIPFRPPPKNLELYLNNSFQPRYKS